MTVRTLLLRDQVSVEVRIVSVSETTMEQMERSRIRRNQKDGLESAILDELQMYRFLESVQSDRRAHLMQMPKITMYEGQEANMQTDFAGKFPLILSRGGK